MQNTPKYPTLYRRAVSGRRRSWLLPSRSSSAAASSPAAAASSPSAVAPSPAAAGGFCPLLWSVSPAASAVVGNPVAPFRNASFPFRAPDKSVCGPAPRPAGGRKRTDSEDISYLCKIILRNSGSDCCRASYHIGLGVGCGFFPEWATRIALTFNDIFGRSSFVIPLLIRSGGAGHRRSGKTAGCGCQPLRRRQPGASRFSGFEPRWGCASFPALLEGSQAVLPDDAGAALTPRLTVQMPPLFGVMSALVLAFVLDRAWPIPIA